MRISKKALGLLVGLIALLIVVAAMGFVVYQIYFKAVDSGVARWVARTVNLPAARVGKRTISYRTYTDTMDAVRKFIASDAGKSVGSNIPPENALKQNVIDRLVRQDMVQELADEKNISVSDDDVRKVFADVVLAAASSSIPDVAQYLHQNYGWNEEQFRQNVLRPALLEQKVAVEMSKEREGDINALENYLTERLAKPDVVIYIQFK